MLKFEILLEETTSEKKTGEDSDVDEEEAKKKTEAKEASTGPREDKK